jgi:hypothetical protein
MQIVMDEILICHAFREAQDLFTGFLTEKASENYISQLNIVISTSASEEKS